MTKPTALDSDTAQPGKSGKTSTHPPSGVLHSNSSQPGLASLDSVADTVAAPTGAGHGKGAKA